VAGANVDGGAGEHEPAHFLGKSRRIDQSQPAALAQTDKVDGRADLIDGNIQVGEVAVDREIPHGRRCRAPVGDEQPGHARLAQRLDDAVTRREIHDGRAVQRIGRANKRGLSAPRHRKTPQPHGGKLERYGIRS